MADVMIDAIRVVRGQPGPEEVAVITAVILARLRNAGPDRAVDGAGQQGTARWRRLDCGNTYQNRRSWKTSP
ncbi:acyl-CoA carboxylase subunit epsilon [Streptomyces sp. NPDC058221]|uniref:acyl-CoA carboxylase subunit epsilon n=1 Tax=Streptomyces sp. NPDC058221 TaxID=3346388 RepID=UPI0036EBACFE